MREQTFNEGKTGTFAQVSTPVDLVTDVRAVLLDIDPSLYARSAFVRNPDVSPEEFYENAVRLWIERHPILAKAEVRVSGRGLHVLLRPEAPIVLATKLDREHWAGRIAAIQASLPIDPHQPGINALTRPLGSINSKNNARVRRLRTAQPIQSEELVALADEMIRTPFSTLCRIVMGDTSVTPCPLCRKADSRLTAQDNIGHCYECGKVNLEKLMGAIYSRSANRSGVHHG